MSAISVSNSGCFRRAFCREGRADNETGADGTEGAVEAGFIAAEADSRIQDKDESCDEEFGSVVTSGSVFYNSLEGQCHIIMRKFT